MNRINRRVFAAGVVALPVAGVLGKVLAEDSTPSPDASATPGSSPMASPGASPAASGGNVLKAEDAMKFDPSEFEAKPGDKWTLENTGVLQHDIAVDDWGGVLTGKPVDGGKSAPFEIPSDAEVGKTYDFYCSVTGHKEAGMVGKIKIV